MKGLRHRTVSQVWGTLGERQDLLSAHQESGRAPNVRGHGQACLSHFTDGDIEVAQLVVTEPVSDPESSGPSCGCWPPAGLSDVCAQQPARVGAGEKANVIFLVRVPFCKSQKRACIHTHVMYICTHAYACTHTHAHCARIHTCIAHMCTHIHTHLRACTCTPTHTHTILSQPWCSLLPG